MKALSEQYYSVRLLLESALPTPSVLVIGSATEQDESGNVACCTARAFAEAGYKTVVVDPHGGSIFQSEYGMKVPLTPDLASMPVSATNGTITNLSAVAMTGQAIRVSTSFKKMQVAIAELRLRFDVIVVNAGAIPLHPEALQFASAADGVVLAFRIGRRPQLEDRQITGMLERVGATVLGVVAIAADGERRPEPAYRPQPEEASVTAETPRRFGATVSSIPVAAATKEAV